MRALVRTSAFATHVRAIVGLASSLLAALVLAYLARRLAQVGAEEGVVIELAEEADALRVFPLHRRQPMPLGERAHLGLRVASDREEGVGQRGLRELRQEVGLVFVVVDRAQQLHRRRQLYRRVARRQRRRVARGARVVARGDGGKVAADSLVEDAKLDARVAQDVGVGRPPGRRRLAGRPGSSPDRPATRPAARTPIDVSAKRWPGIWETSV